MTVIPEEKRLSVTNFQLTFQLNPPVVIRAKVKKCANTHRWWLKSVRIAPPFLMTVGAFSCNVGKLISVGNR